MSVISNDSRFSSQLDKPLELNNQRTVQTNDKYFKGTPINQDKLKKSKQVINAIYRDRSNKHLKVNLDFQEYLFARDDVQDHTPSHYGMGIVSFIGDKGTGKALLADSIISEDYGRVIRGFSKCQNTIINSSFYQYEGYLNNPIQMFVHRKQISKDSFMWVYFISSIIVLSVKQNDNSHYKHFIKALKFAKKNFQSNQGQLSKPKLIIAIKDSKNAIPDYNELNKFLDEVEETQLFDRNISTITFPYPGNKGVLEKELLDVPLKQLSPQYLIAVKRLSHMIKSAPPKNIMGNIVTSKFLSYILDAISNEINSNGSLLRVNKIWDDIVEQYGIGYHNFYLKQYTDKLGRQFQDQRPRSQYQLYNVMVGLKRSVDRKSAGFQNLNDDPVFQKYKQKVHDSIGVKQKQIMNVNQIKSEQQNNHIANSVFLNAGKHNFPKKIDQYNQNSLFEYHKSDSLIDAFSKFNSDQNGEKVGVVVPLELETRQQRDSVLRSEQHGNSISQINNEEIEEKRRRILLLENENKQKQMELNQMQSKYSQLKGTLPLRNNNRNSEELEAQLAVLKSQYESKTQHNQKLNEQKQYLIKSKIDELNQQLQKQQQYSKSYLKPSATPNKQVISSTLKTRQAETGKKDVNCSIM